MVGSVRRIFVALGLPPELRQYVADAADAAQLPGRRVDEADLHITLRYLGDVDEVSFDRLLMAMDDQNWPAPFALRLGALGAFPNPRAASVAWVGVDDSVALAETHAQVEDACDAAGLGREDRPFRPHLTVTRVRPPADIRSTIRDFPPLALSFSVDRIAVLRSQGGRPGPKYELLESFPFDGSHPG